MTDTEVASALKGFLAEHYPDMLIEVKTKGGSTGEREVWFVEEGFRDLYPMQRYHYLMHLIPEQFYKEELSGAIWHECAPGEDPNDLMFPDEDLVQNIASSVLGVLHNCSFFQRLDATMCTVAERYGAPQCEGDFAQAKKVLSECGRPEPDFFDIFHVLMGQGAYCDCEILCNVTETSEFRRRYWHERGLTSGCT